MRGKKLLQNFNRLSIAMPVWISCVCILLLYLFLLLSKLTMIWLLFGSYFDVLSWWEIGKALKTSFIYDAYVIAVFLLPLLLLLFIPVKGKWLIKLLVLLIGLVISSVSFFIIGDIIFFSLFFNHFTTEPITALSHIPFILSMAFSEYWYITYPLIAFCCVALFYLNKWIDQEYKVPSFSFRSWGIRLGIIVLIVLGIIFGTKGRLSFHGRSLSTMPAQQLINPKMSDIALNGVFTSLKSLRHYQQRKLFFDEEKSVAFLKQQVFSENEIILNEEYPLWRVRAGKSSTIPLNAVIILLESWDKKYLNARPDITPFYHKLKEKSLYYEHFYSTGSRSLMGVTSSFFSIPYVWGLPYLNTGLEQYHFPRWASLLQKGGWQTLFVQSDYRMSEKAAEWTKYLGFGAFYGKEDIPLFNDYPSFNKGFDMEAGNFLFQKIEQTAKPFFAVFYTSSTHSPYSMVLSSQHMPFPNPKDQYEQYYNRLNYADDALKEFFSVAQKEDWFKNTVFFIFPDHRAIFSGTPLGKGETPYDSFLLVYAPGIISAGVSQKVVASQEDILPSVLDLIQADIPFVSSGSSIFNKDRINEKFVYSENGDVYVFNRDKKERFSVKNLQDTNPSAWPESFKKAILFNEGIYHVIKENKIIPKLDEK